MTSQYRSRDQFCKQNVSSVSTYVPSKFRPHWLKLYLEGENAIATDHREIKEDMLEEHKCHDFFYFKCNLYYII